MMTGTVQRREGRIVLVDLGRVTGILRSEDQIPTERYNSGDRIKVYVKQVSLTTKGPEIVLSRTSEDVVRKLFSVEIPEVSEGSVEIKSIAREAGSRSKVAVATSNPQIDQSRMYRTTRHAHSNDYFRVGWRKRSTLLNGIQIR